MMVSKAELKCYEYINSIRDIENYAGMGIYGLDNRRTQIHDELCSLFSLSKDITKSITDNLNMNDDRIAENLYLSLLDKSREDQDGPINIKDSQDQKTS